MGAPFISRSPDRRLHPNRGEEIGAAELVSRSVSIKIVDAQMKCLGFFVLHGLKESHK